MQGIVSEGDSWVFIVLSSIRSKDVERGFLMEADILLFWSHSSRVIIYCWKCMVAVRIWWCCEVSERLLA